MNPTPRTEDAKHRYWMGGHWSDKFFRFAQVLESENITLEARVAELEKDKERLDWLTNEVGDTHQATDSTVRIFQDDATHDFFVNDHFGRSIRQAIDTAMKGGSK